MFYGMHYLQDLPRLVDVSSRTLLGQFKKLYKRRDDSLKEWEASGHHMKVVQASDQSVLLSIQTAARQHAIPTHTFATRHASQGKDRSAIIVGPSTPDIIDNLIGSLETLGA